MPAGGLKNKTRKNRSGEDLFDQLIAINRKAFELGRFSAAYHALAAAMNWANEDNDEAQLGLVKKLASEQLVWIDLHAPKYEHSTQSAGVRGHASVFSNLERQVHSALLRIGSQRKFDQMLHSWPSEEDRRED